MMLLGPFLATVHQMEQQFNARAQRSRDSWSWGPGVTQSTCRGSKRLYLAVPGDHKEPMIKPSLAKGKVCSLTIIVSLWSRNENFEEISLWKGGPWVFLASSDFPEKKLTFPNDLFKITNFNISRMEMLSKIWKALWFIWPLLKYIIRVINS